LLRAIGKDKTMLQNRINAIAESNAANKVYHDSESLRMVINKWLEDKIQVYDLTTEANAVLTSFLEKVYSMAIDHEINVIEERILTEK
jgi:hypothetical protein